MLCAGRSGLLAVAADTATNAMAFPLPDIHALEQAGSEQNTGELLVNWTSERICTNTPTHPDGASLVSHPREGIWCYSGTGAWLNEHNGQERALCRPIDYWCRGDCQTDCTYGLYDPARTHRVEHNGYIVPAAKRPAVKPNGEAIPNSRIVWRIYAENYHNPPGL